MSAEGKRSEDLQHTIETWESDMCSHLLPYWREMFRAHSCSDNYGSRKTPPYQAVQKETVELIFYLCGLLKQSLPVCFLSIDIFDNFLANHMCDMWKSVEQLLKRRNETMKNFPVYWALMASHIKEQLLLRVLSSVQLASKMVYSPNQITCSELSDIIRRYDQYYDLTAIRKSEFRVFKTLHFRVPTCNALECLELLIRRCCPPESQTQIHTTAVQVLKVCYLQKDIIRQLHKENHPTTVSACSLIVSAHIRDVTDADTLCARISQETKLSARVLNSYSTSILQNILK